MLIAPGRLWSDGALRTGLAVRIEGGRIVWTGPAGGTPDLAPHLLIPAPTDLQVNGGGGTMLNADPTPEGLARIVSAHRALGTGEMLVTVITDAPEVMEAAAAAAISAKGLPGLLGLHIEGPHIAPSRRGTHDPSFIRPLDARTARCVERLREAGVPVMLTLAPERSDPALMGRLRAAGAVLSAGHSAATAEEARRGFAAGIGCVTHLFNAMDPMTSRAPGLLGAAILSDAFCGLIADGIHVGWDMIRIALAARPPRRTFLVSDAMATAGGPDSFELYGRTITVREGALVNSEGSLAGAHLDMATALRRLHRDGGVPLADAVAMATDVPRAAMGLAPRRIAPGLGAEWLTAFDADLRPVPVG